nr:hypothetical protein [Methylomarinum sp. Ch1-1]MDP4522747.1 hypothetical protein [Methylomarinum sp. Ch1-1]
MPGNNGTSYLEACRLKRINGKFRVFQDWHLHGSTFAAAAQDAFTPGATNSVITQYRTYIKDYVSQVVANKNNLPVTTITNPATSFVWPPAGNTTYPITTRFIARGIYMDYMDPFTLAKLDDVRINQPNTFFENVPFNEINLTRLTDWQPECVDSSGETASTNTGKKVIDKTTTAGGCVTNFGIRKASTTPSINRGEVQVLSVSDVFTLDAKILLSNTGIVGVNDYLPESTTTTLYPTSNDRAYDITEVKYSYQIGTEPTTVIITVTVNLPNSWNNNFSVSAEMTPNGSCQDNSTTLSCVSTTSSWSGAITVNGEHTKANGTLEFCSGTINQSATLSAGGYTREVDCN